MSRSLSLATRGKMGSGGVASFSLARLSGGKLSAEPPEVVLTVEEPQQLDDDAENFANEISFPFRILPDSELELSQDETAVIENIQLALLVRQGEWYMDPLGGCKLWDFLFEQNDEVLAGLLDFHVRQTLNREEPRALFDEVLTEAKEEKVDVIVPFRVIPSGTKLSLKVGLPKVGI